MKLIKYLAIAAVAFGLTSCIEETFPQDNYMTSDQMEGRADAIDGFVNAIVGNPVKAHVYYSENHTDIGYPGLGMIRDVMCEDFPVYSNSYDYFSYYSTNMYLGEYQTSDMPWILYYKYIGNCNNVLRMEISSETERHAGIAHFYRAFFYFDLARMYEYKETGYETLDAQAASNDIAGLTVPIVTETTTEEEGRNLPRAPFYDMYRFLLDDLDAAEHYLTGKARVSKNHPDIAAVEGERARIYLDIASRFDFNPSDIEKMKSAGVDLGVNSAVEAYQKAAEHARKAISMSGSPMNQNTWQTSGFYDISTPAWMLGFSMNKEGISEDSWDGWISYMAPETLYGLAGLSEANGYLSNTYATQRMISTDLWNRISDSDWRKLTWIAPEHAGKAAYKSWYASNVSDEFFSLLPAYTGLKFRPRNGEMTDYSIGSAVDYPLMRVEEMYFIEAEALAGAQGVAAGVNALKNFLNVYRYADASYDLNIVTMNDFRTNLMIQKRIEFWGEGIMAWDYKRLNLQVRRGYDGSNFPDQYMLNSKMGYCAPWFNYFIMKYERGLNPAMKPNPDPSTVSCLWK